MQTQSEVHIPSHRQEIIANILRFVSWVSLWLQLGLGAACCLMLLFAISGRNFSQTVAPTQSIPGVSGVVRSTQVTTPGTGLSIFWAVCGVVVLLFSLYLAFRLTRFARRLHNQNPEIHPKKADVIQLLRIAAIAGLLGMLLTILGGGSSVGVLLEKSISQPQGIAIYDPNRIIRSVDIFLAMANMTGIAAHFVGTVTALGLINWLHPSEAKG